MDEVEKLIYEMNEKLGVMDGKMKMVLKKLDLICDSNSIRDAKIDKLEERVTTHGTYFKVIGVFITIITSLITTISGWFK